MMLEIGPAPPSAATCADPAMSLVLPAPALPVARVAGAPGDLFPIRRIYCVGRNYVEHAKEMGFTGREPPFFFLKPTDAAVPVAEGETGRIRYPSLTKDLHHEVELVVAIGRGGSDIPAARALEHIWGYAVGLDMTRRDLQGEMKKLARPWCIGKAFEDSAPIGEVRPAAPSRHDAPPPRPHALHRHTRHPPPIGKLIWSVPEIIEHLSKAWTLAPGDLIYTGTPEGVAATVRGDILEASVAGVGSLKLEVV